MKPLFLTLATVLATWFSNTQAQTFNCDSQLYQVVNGRDLKVLVPATGVYETIGTSADTYNGAGFNSQDNYIYGIGSGNTLLKINNTGTSTNLGTIANFSALSYSGDFDLDGNWYSFIKSGSTWLMNSVDVSALPPVAQEFTMTELSGVTDAVKTNDIAYNVLTDKFYGMSAGVLVEFDHVNHTVRAIADYSAETDGGGYGAVWTDEVGNTYFFNNGTGNIYRAHFNADGSIASFNFISTSSPNGNNDGMSCPTAPAPVFPEICDNGIDDDGDGLVDCEDPDCTSTETCGVTSALHSTSFGCEGSIVTYHAFFTNNSSQTNTITVSEVLPQGFTFIQDTIEFDAGGYSNFEQQPVEGNAGEINWGSLVLEGGETVRISYDVLLDNTIIIGEQTNNLSVSLSQPGTVAFPATIAQPIAVGLCPEPNTYTCEPAFYQVYKKKGRKEPNVFGKLDPITGDYNAIAIASDYANGLGYDINTGLVYGASGRRFIQLDEDGIVIDQGITFAKNVYRGDINENSEWYGVEGIDMIKIDVSSTPNVVATYAGQGLEGWDIAYNTDGHFYSLHNATLQQFNTITNTKMTLGSITGYNLLTGGYGAQWTGSDGYLYASHNKTGNVLRIDVNTLEARLVSLSTAELSKNDGFSCPTEIPVVYEFDYSDNSVLPLSRILSYRQDLGNDNIPDFSNFWLGNTVNFESTDPSNATATGDLDDGFTLSTEISGSQLSAVIGLNANMEGWAYYMLGIDWDNNGTFDKVQIDSSYLTTSETVIKSIDVPEGFTEGTINVRVIISEGILTASQLSGDILELGEVEDYIYNLTTICDGENCAVSTGANGGLESNGGLAVAIAKRNYTRVKTSNKSHLRKFQLTIDQYKRTSTARSEGIDNYFPTTGLSGNEEVTVSSPKDLIALTNATDLFAVDYYLNDNRIAASLLLKTENEVYNHSKNVCDRLNGKSIEDVQVMNLDGVQVIYAKIKNEYGGVEYSSWFSAKDMTDHYETVSLWNVDSYDAGSYLNFQVWSSSPGQVFFILKHALKQLRAEKSVTSDMTKTALPEVIVKKGRYENGKLTMTFLNKNHLTEAVVDASIRTTENEPYINEHYVIALDGSLEQELIIETGFLFDVGLSVKTADNAAYDALYLADGAWGVDFNSDLSSVNIFDIEEVQNNPAPNTHLVERNFNISGSSTDVVNVFRNLKAGEKTLICEAFSTVSFTIKNNHPVEIVLVENGLNNWDTRLRYTIAAHDSDTYVVIPLSSFVGERVTNNMELKSIVFSYINKTGERENYDIVASNITFGSEMILSNNADDRSNTDSVTIYPNPVKDTMTVALSSEKGGEYRLFINDISGKTIFSQMGYITGGHQKINVKSLSIKSGMYVLIIKLPLDKTISKKVAFK